MKKILLVLTGVLFFANLCFAALEEKIFELAEGQIKFEVTYSEPKDYVEVFIKKNDVQTVAVEVTSSRVANSDGTYSYQLIHGGFVAGDLVEARFYSHAQGVQEFTPASFLPGFISWGNDLIYTNPAGGSPYITELANGKLLFKLGDTERDYVEIFVRKNGVQMRAEDITGTYNVNQHAYQFLDSGYRQGDEVEVRFYSHGNGARKFIPGGVEHIWSKHRYGSYGKTTFKTNDAVYTIGARTTAEGKPVHTEAFFDIGFDYLTPTHKSSQGAINWIVDRALAASVNRDFLLNTVEFKGLYVRHCVTGEWINVNDTVYAPLESPLRLGPQMFSVVHHYANTSINTLLDTDFACPDMPARKEWVMVGGIAQHVLSVGRVHFAYVVEHQ